MMTMRPAEDYDLIVVGSGEAGKYIAWSLASQGERVVVVEKKYIGGSCPNIACLPSKNIIHGAKVASFVARSEDFGIVKSSWKVDMVAVRNRKRMMVDRLVAINQSRYTASGTELIIGVARFVGPRTVEVKLPTGGVCTLRGKRVVISTGFRATIDPVAGLREALPITHVEALELDYLPEHLIVLGGGFVGLELAQAFRRFGCNVTLLERARLLAHREDRDVSDALRELLEGEGVHVQTGVTVKSVVGRSGRAVRLNGTMEGMPFVLQGTDLLVTTGRTPNTEDLGLEVAGVQRGPDGHIQVNDRLETTAEEVWAVGDCAGSPHFTHIAFDDFRIVRDNLAGGNRVTTNRLVPFCLFTDPELARVGLNESEARVHGIAYRLAKIPMSMVLRTHTLSATRGFMKALIDVTSNRILGFTAFGPEAGEIMAVVQLAISAGLPYTALRDSILTHPTMAEGLVPLFSAVGLVQP